MNKLKTESSQHTTIILCTVALYAACFQAQMPVQPYLLKSMSQNSVSDFGKFRSYVAGLQFIGGLVAGSLIDRWGAKSILALSLMASAVSYFLSGMATDMSMLYLAQIPTLAQHAVMASRSYFSLSVEEGSNRAKMLGYVTSAYAVGLICGPFIGGILSDSGLQVAAMVAAVVSLFNTIFVIMFLVTPKHETSSLLQPAKVQKGNYSALLGNSRILYGLVMKSFFVFAINLFQSGLQIVLPERFGITAKETGYFLSFIGVIALIASMLMVKPFYEWYGQRTVLLATNLTLFVCFMIFMVIDSPIQLIILAIPHTAANVVFAAISTQSLTSLVLPEQQGILTAVDMGCGSLIRIITPQLSAFLFSTFGFWSLGATSAALVGISFVLALVGAAVPLRKKE